MTATLPALNLAPYGKWPDRTPIEAPPKTPGVVLVTQWEDLGNPGPHPVHGQRIVSVALYHPTQQAYIAVTTDLPMHYMQDTSQADLPGRFVWRHDLIDEAMEPTELGPHLYLTQTEEGQPWEEIIDPGVKETLLGIALDLSETRPVRTWWFPYLPGGRVFDPKDTKTWRVLNNQIGHVITQPCGNRGPKGHFAVINDTERHRRVGRDIQSPLTTLDAVHPAIRTDLGYSLHLLCQTGRCVTQASGEAVFPTRHATVDGVNMLYDILVASGEDLETLHDGPGRARLLMAEAEQTLDHILAKPAGETSLE